MKSELAKPLRFMICTFFGFFGFLGPFGGTAAIAQGTVQYVHTDALGSRVIVTDANGNVIEREIYEPYGSPLLQEPSDEPGFTGHVSDSATGLTYMQQRYYDPLLGRFLSVDPVTAYSNPINYFNRYKYADNNPYTFTDPDGRSFTCDANSCTIECSSLGTCSFDYVSVALVYGSRLLQNAINEIQQQEQAPESAGDDENEGGERNLGDLEPIHASDHPQNDPEIGRLSDEELGEAINNPVNGDRVTVRGNRVLDGNTRINEAKDRGWPDDTTIPVDELPELPDNIDDDPLGPYGDL